MDLISIRRKYINKRNSIIIAFLLVLLIMFIIVIREINRNKKIQEFYVSYEDQIEHVKGNKQANTEKQKAEEEANKMAKLPQLTEEAKNNLANIYHSENKRVFLTFDDGPSQTVTPVILDTLTRENIKATFFLLGSRVELSPDIVKREYEEGHYLASHGYSHVYSQIYASPQSVLDEYNKSIILIKNAIGVQEYEPHLFRFPGGYIGGKYAKVKQSAAQILDQNGILHVDWNALTSDSAGAKTIEEFIAELEKTVPKHNSVVVLMHDAGNKTATAEALPTIIQYFRERGFEFENFYSIII